mgnify:CR=1 FL=1
MPGGEGCCKEQRAKCGGQSSYQKEQQGPNRLFGTLVPFWKSFRPTKGQRLRDEIDSTDGGEGKLKADAGRGIGTLQEKQKQNGGQGSGLIVLPAEKGGQEEEPFHESRPERRGRIPSHGGEKEDQGHSGEERALPVPAQKEGEHRGQKTDVEPGQQENTLYRP